MRLREVVHASAVALDGRAALLMGPPGAGKSRLAIELLAFGAGLVADDATELSLRGGRVFASAHEAALPLIEARGVGLLPAPLVGPAEVALAVDLAQHSAERLPPRRVVQLLGVELPLLSSPTAAVVLHCLRNGPPVDPEASRLQRG